MRGKAFSLTNGRAKPVVPFGGKYRLIEFVLANFVNSGIRRIYVLTQFKLQLLIDHLAAGWHLSDFLQDRFVKAVPAQMRAGANAILFSGMACRHAARRSEPVGSHRERGDGRDRGPAVLDGAMREP